MKDQRRLLLCASRTRSTPRRFVIISLSSPIPDRTLHRPRCRQRVILDSSGPSGRRFPLGAEATGASHLSRFVVSHPCHWRGQQGHYYNAHSHSHLRARLGQLRPFAPSRVASSNARRESLGGFCTTPTSRAPAFTLPAHPSAHRHSSPSDRTSA